VIIRPAYFNFNTMSFFIANTVHIFYSIQLTAIRAMVSIVQIIYLNIVCQLLGLLQRKFTVLGTGVTERLNVSDLLFTLRCILE